jgi:hypothetical protein
MLYLTYMWHVCHMYDMYVAYMSHMWHIYNIHVIYVTCYLYVAYMTHIWHVFHIWLTLFHIYAIHGHDISRIYVFQIYRIYVAYTIHIWYTYESYMKYVCDIYVTSHVSDVIYANIVHIDKHIWQNIWHTEHIHCGPKKTSPFSFFNNSVKKPEVEIAFERKKMALRFQRLSHCNIIDHACPT